MGARLLEKGRAAAARLDFEKFIALRPVLLHVTSRQNLEWIRRDGRFRPAASILRAAGLGGLVRERRPEAMVVRVPDGDGGRDVYVRDQRPLRAGNMRLLGGWDVGDFVAELNEHVFFWPCGAGGPGAYGRRLFERYRGEDQVVISLGTRALIEENRDRLRVCACNSGAPRCNPRTGKAARGAGGMGATSWRR